MRIGLFIWEEELFFQHITVLTSEQEKRANSLLELTPSGREGT